jgi:hypothetical protein
MENIPYCKSATALKLNNMDRIMTRIQHAEAVGVPLF